MNNENNGGLGKAAAIAGLIFVGEAALIVRRRIKQSSAASKERGHIVFPPDKRDAKTGLPSELWRTAANKGA